MADKRMSTEEKKEEDEISKYAAAGVAAVAGAALVAWGVSWLFPSSGSEEEPLTKMMKAPGRPGVQIPRAEFAKDPKSYFRDLHKGGS